jgi:hypothetical protein
VEGYTARDALIVMRLDLAESLQQIEQEIAELTETLEFCGIAGHMLGEENDWAGYPAIRRWLETVSNSDDLRRDLEELRTERDEIASALDFLADRLVGTS